MSHRDSIARLLIFALVAALLGLTVAPVMTQGQGQGQGQGQSITASSMLRQGTPAPAGPWTDRTLLPDQRADMVIAQMTLDEKIQLLHGGQSGGRGQPSLSNGGAGWIPGIPRLGIPDINMADSAVGVTRGAAMSRYSTLLPSSLGLAATWDATGAHLYGSVIGRELRDQGYNMSIGGGVDITREPRNGRNFEYAGEDPILAGTMVGQLMKGVQDQHIMGDLKHYALNDQETGRNIGNVVLDVRSMRETDLLAFEIAHRISQAAGVMCAYNKVNGDWACENDYLLNRVLKKSFGFKGWVLSDWGGTHSTTKAIVNGLDQEMPGSGYFGDALKKAIEVGEVPQARVDDAVHRILRSMFAVGVIDDPPARQVVDVFRGLADAQRLAEESIVLLKNANGQLPLNAAVVRSIAVIGGHADVGVPSGGGSAQVNPPGGNAVQAPPRAGGAPPAAGGGGSGRGATNPLNSVYFPSSPLKAIRVKAPTAKIEFNDGSDPAAAAKLAKASDVAIVFAVQPMSEGRDSATLGLPGDQDALVAAVAAANPHTIVVLETGGPVSMPWIANVSGVLAAWFPGIGGGPAIANILFGNVNPSGKLPVTFAKSEKDLPHPEIPGMPPPTQPAAAGPLSAPMIIDPAAAAVIGATVGSGAGAGRGAGAGGSGAQGGGGGRGGGRGSVPPFDIPYTEALKVGYKWFQAENKQPLFPFGFGLSYTTFAYSALKASASGGDVTVTFTVSNAGKRAGAEIAQVYISLPPATNEPPKRLVAWERVELAAGASKVVTLKLDPLFLSIFNVSKDGWELAPGDYKVLVGGSSESTPLAASVRIAGTPRP
jgi:beta-glucosidase